MEDEIKKTKEIQNRLSKIEGQVRGVSRMVKAGRSEKEILTQLAAIKSGVLKVAFLIGTRKIDVSREKLSILKNFFS